MVKSVNCWHFKADIADIAAKIIIINFHISKKKILIKIYEEPKSI